MTETGLDDTIAAIATAPGRGAVALIRISGAEAVDALLAVCPDLDGKEPRPRIQRLLRICDPTSGRLIDRALVALFPAPGSYTGEDCVEISTHGGVLTPKLVLDLILARGIRLALPGEFSRRALLNGKLDLPQAEAILDLIDARSPAFHRSAVDQLERGLSKRVVELRSRILDVEAMVAYGIDFPDEDEPPVPAERIRAAGQAAIDGIQTVLDTAPQGDLLRRGAMIVLAGAPNSGKSSLFNALLGLERAIVTDTPGTTRDAVEAEITLDGFPFRLVDTAGLRDASDQVEALGVEVARRYLASADLVLFCADLSVAPLPGQLEFVAALDPRRLLLVRTKADLTAAVSASDSVFAELNAIQVSSRTGEGLATLRQALVDAAFSGVARASDRAPLVTAERHARALQSGVDELHLFLDALAAGVPSELGVTHLRSAAEAMEDIIGVVSTDDVLGRVFGRFCVGK